MLNPHVDKSVNIAYNISEGNQLEIAVTPLALQIQKNESVSCGRTGGFLFIYRVFL